jgi:hypothetical protein
MLTRRLSRSEWIAVGGGLLQLGWFRALIGIAPMMVGGAKRATEVERARKPPGVL